MSAKLPEADARHCIELLRQGKKATEVSRITGISVHPIYRIAKEEGINLGVERHTLLDFEKILDLFNAGVGCRGIAKRLGENPATIRKALIANGIKPRNRSEQQKARMDNSTPEQIAQLTRKAHAAARGRVKTPDELRKMAQSRFEAQSTLSSDLEEDFDKLMRDRGHVGIRQFAIDKYNADFVFGNVAVEIFGGYWHWHGHHAARANERIKTILDSGFHLIILAFRRGGITPEAVDKTVSLLEELGRDESSIRHYRMITSDGQTAISQSSDDNDFTIEWPFGNERDAATGRYMRVR